MVARKAGPKTRTYAEMSELGCQMVGMFPKEKFIMLLKARKKKELQPDIGWNGKIPKLSA